MFEWTTEPPTEPGWYWHKQLAFMEVENIIYLNENHVSSNWHLNGQGHLWAGPIPEPKEQPHA